jgi:riboflavin synthase
MFTGIIEETGTIRAVKKGRISASLRIDAQRVLEDVKTGDSINTNGVCLTVTAFDENGFEVDVMAETMRKTNLGALVPGSKVNLERALRLSDRLGGHLVSGHIDGTGTIAGMEQEENATWITIRTERQITRYIVSRGSVALDGISLTVVDVNPGDFRVSIIPHTGQETTLLEKKAGDTLNIECDITAKYIEKFLREDAPGRGENIDINFLNKHGFID